MPRQRSQGYNKAAPMTAEALLRMDNIPASAPIREEMRRDLAERAMLITSSRADFNPRQHFTPVKGWEGRTSTTGKWRSRMNDNR